MPTLGALTLPADPVWTDEFPSDWSPVARSGEYSLTGAYIVQESVRLTGRPITLDVAWLTRAELIAVDALAAMTEQKHTLVIAQGTFTVMFRDPPYTVDGLRQVSDPDNSEPYQVTLNLHTA